MREVKRLKGLVERLEGDMARERKEAESRCGAQGPALGPSSALPRIDNLKSFPRLSSLSQPLLKEASEAREAAKKTEAAFREANSEYGHEAIKPSLT